MDAKARCPNPACAREYRVKAESLGKTATCKSCGRKFVLAARAADAPSASALLGERAHTNTSADVRSALASAEALPANGAQLDERPPPGSARSPSAATDLGNPVLKRPRELSTLGLALTLCWFCFGLPSILIPIAAIGDLLHIAQISPKQAWSRAMPLALVVGVPLIWVALISANVTVIRTFRSVRRRFPSFFCVIDRDGNVDLDSSNSDPVARDLELLFFRSARRIQPVSNSLGLSIGLFAYLPLMAYVRDCARPWILPAAALLFMCAVLWLSRKSWHWVVSYTVLILAIVVSFVAAGVPLDTTQGRGQDWWAFLSLVGPLFLCQALGAIGGGAIGAVVALTWALGPALRGQCVRSDLRGTYRSGRAVIEIGAWILLSPAVGLSLLLEALRPMINKVTHHGF